MEREESLNFNMDEMDMRFYDVAIGRWQVIDPIIHHKFSPYQAFDNNPILWADPSGADAIQSALGVKYTGQDAINVFKQISISTTPIKKNADDKEDQCPDCDDKDILLTFVNKAAILNGIEGAEDVIYMDENPYDQEGDRLRSRKNIEGELVKIEGSDRLKPAEGLDKVREWIFGGTVSMNDYSFIQEFKITETNGKEHNLQAEATIFIKEKSEMNILEMSHGDMGGMHQGDARRILFFNSSGKKIAQLVFKNQNHLNAFIFQYYTKPRTKKKAEHLEFLRNNNKKDE